MSKIAFVKNRTRRIVVGDLNQCVQLLPRSITEPAFGETEFTEDFEGGKTAWAKVITTAGKTLFNGVNADVSATHEIYIRFDPEVTSETWVRLDDGTLLDVLDTDDLDEKGEWLLLVCTERGRETLKAAQA